MPQPSPAETIAKFTPKPPKQVSDAASNIDAMILAQKNPPAGDPPAQDNQPPATPPATPPQDSPANPPAPPPQQPVPPAPPPPADDAEQRYRSMEGRYRDQVKLNQELSQRLADMERIIAATPPAPAAPPPPAARLVTPEEETEYGTELLDVTARRAKEVLAPELSAFEMRFKNLEQRIEGVSTVTAKTAQERMYADLTSAVPNWREINYDQRYLEWLSFLDPYAGRPRGEMLKEAFSRQETNRVIQFFKGFVSEVTGTPPSPTQPAPTPAPQAPPAAPTLEDLAAPGRARSAPTPPGAPPEKPTYTSAFYGQFMREKLQGKWKGREAEAEALERDIFAAQHEGRFIV